MQHEKTKRPTHGMRREERLALFRKNLIQALPRLAQRRAGEIREGGRAPDKSVRLKIGRVVQTIRSISKEIGPVRDGL
ncbi:hypothetical protein K2P56_00340 [Patescibacteria group bacterium]|nr:hypothetical protein [Patescibacteria group bacterium]